MIYIRQRSSGRVLKKNARSYPYAGDAQSERELMDLADEKRQEKDRV